jgi:transcription initiation factor TFIID TATA-box-binding protein
MGLNTFARNIYRGFFMTDFKIRVENIVASAALGVTVPLEKIVSKLEGMEYEPEQFPGVVYRL